MCCKDLILCHEYSIFKLPEALIVQLLAMVNLDIRRNHGQQEDSSILHLFDILKCYWYWILTELIFILILCDGQGCISPFNKEGN